MRIPLDLPDSRRLNLLPLIGVVFFVVCGGAYGLEPVVAAVGGGWAVALIVLAPLVWSLPIALMVAELTSMMPADGGYYVWVRTALGDFWGVQEAWWTLCYTFIDVAIYPVLFVNYLAFFYPWLRLDEHGSASWSVLLCRWAVALAVIASALLVNWRGVSAVGQSAAWNTALVLLPFAVLVVVALRSAGALHETWSLVTRELKTNHQAGLLTLGFSTVLWNYMGWDNTSTFAGEVNDARRNYPRALAVVMLVTIAAYLAPVFAGLAVTTSPDAWSESQGWPVIAALAGGHWFGLLLAGAALVAMWSIFNSQLLYSSRLPYVMARDGWLPAPLAAVSTRTAMPVGALIGSCAVSSLFAALSFGKLVVIDVLLYSAALSLEYAALLALRWTQPEMERPFRIPGGWAGVVLVTLAPLGCAGFLLVSTLRDPESDPRQLLVVATAIASGIALYVVRRKYQRATSDTHWKPER
jgi:amino acid transporter